MVERVHWPQGDSHTVSIYLKPQASVMHCERCGAQCSQVHETTTRRVRDLALFEYRVVLHVPRRRLWCDSCQALGLWLPRSGLLLSEDSRSLPR